MRGWGQMRAWLRAHPTGADALLALAVFVVALMIRPDAPPRLPELTVVSTGLLAASCAGLVVRRRYPLGVWFWTLTAAVLGITLAQGPSAVVVPMMVALLTVASRTPRRTAVLVAIGSAVALVFTIVLVQVQSWQNPTTYAVFAWCGMVAAVGIALRGQRAVVAAAQDRARRAEESREEEAQRRVAEERLRIARDLHDVMAHHIAVISVQSGVARHLLDSNPDEARAALSLVRQASQVVLSEMSTIVGLLRTTEDGADLQPTPGLAHVEELVESMRHAGLRTTWSTSGVPTELATIVDLTAYRVIQEALTNAHKHGLGEAQVSVAYRPGLVVIDVINPMASRPSPGAEPGHGILGMNERVAAVGGTLVIGPTSANAFAVHAELPGSTP